MISFTLLTVLRLNLLNKTNSVIYFVEPVAVWVFGADWIIKTLEINETQIGTKEFE